MSEGPSHGSRAVAIGGGHGLAASLVALRAAVDHVTAVVTVADDGGSSGRLRRDLGVLAPGDLRMALASLAQDRELAELVQYRFERGELAGHSLGNLMLVALADLADGDMVAALDRLGGRLGVPGRVVPCTSVPVSLRAESPSGTVHGQAAIARTAGLHRLRLDPEDPPAGAAAVAAIADADLVVLGPGSLFTSLLPNLLVPGIAAAVAAATGPVVLVANLSQQRGETEGLTLTDHLDVLAEHVPEVRLDVVLADRGQGPVPGAGPLPVDQAALRDRVGEVVVDAFHDGRGRHDASVLTRHLAALVAPSR